MPPPQLERTIDFTKFTLGLAAAGFAYIAETAVKRHDWCTKGIGLFSLACFAVSVVFGAMVLGRATKVENLDNEKTLLFVGKVHSLFLALGLASGAVVVVIRIIVQGE